MRPYPPVTIPAMVKLLPEVAASPLDAVSVTPRLLSSDAAPVDCKTPPPKLIDAGVVLPGTAPKLRSVEMLNIPALIVVVPV